MAKKKCGQYVIGLGIDFKMKKESSGYGYDTTLIPNNYYVVHASTGKILGAYAEESKAITLAVGLDKRDHNTLASEMEKVLIED